MNLEQEKQYEQEAKDRVVRPVNYKRHHKFPTAWHTWQAFVKWVFYAWPRNS